MGLVHASARARLSRRYLSAALIAIVWFTSGGRAFANDGAGRIRHGLSSFGELKYAPEFKHFDYVNPAAPKGGRIVTVGTGALSTFDSFHPFILKGDAAQGIAELTFDSLMTRAMDEPDSAYGLVAQSVEIAADGLSVTYRLRPEARFSDGSPVTAADCVFSLTAIKDKGHPNLMQMLKDIASVEALDPLTVRYRFTGTQIRSLPGLAGGLPILQKAQFDARPFDQSGLEPLLGSGPYKIGEYKQGAFVAFNRRADYWARDLPVNRGRYNFDEVRYDYYRQRQIGVEAIKGGLLDVREEFTSKEWATAYNIPAVAEKRLLLETLPDKNPSGMQGFWINSRRAKFADPQVRLALDLAFDFEWTNKNLFYGLYQRVGSFFENSAMKAEGLPSETELALLEPFRAKLPKAVFTEPYVPPVSDGTGNDRKLMREAGRLLSAAGWDVKNGVRTNARGEAFAIEFMTNDPTSERLLAPYVKNLQALGITTSIRLVDPAQYERRRKSFDYDVLSARFVLGITPGPELRSFFGSETAVIEGSYNLSGIADPVIDHLIARLAEAKSRGDLVTAARALDRVLRAGHYWVPQWYKASHTLALWDKFSRPAVKPAFDRGIVDTWWFDTEKAARLKPN
jgi:microcin C transport system substrate-binding protein